MLLAAACHHDPAPTAPTAPPPTAAEPAPTISKPEDPRIAKLREFRDRACACKDKPCVDAVQQDLIGWASSDKTKGKPSEADAKAADEIMSQFEKCVEAAGGKF